MQDARRWPMTSPSESKADHLTSNSLAAGTKRLPQCERGVPPEARCNVEQTQYVAQLSLHGGRTYTMLSLPHYELLLLFPACLPRLNDPWCRRRTPCALSMYSIIWRRSFVPVKGCPPALPASTTSKDAKASAADFAARTTIQPQQSTRDFSQTAVRFACPPCARHRLAAPRSRRDATSAAAQRAYPPRA